jgi:hypothetical protein
MVGASTGADGRTGTTECGSSACTTRTIHDSVQEGVMLETLQAIQQWLNSTLFGNWGALVVLTVVIGSTLGISRISKLGQL